MTSLPLDRDARKRLGAWYTPPPFIKAIVRWAVRSPDVRILDPAVGDGDFLLEAADRLRALGQQDPEHLLFGVDISAQAVATTAVAVRRFGGNGANLIHRNFFEVRAPTSFFPEFPTVQAVVGNPPYVRYQRFGGLTRVLALDRARENGVNLSGLCSAWAPFVVHAASFLSQGGRLGLVLPEELVHASYADPIREFLRRTFHSVAIVAFDGYTFPRSQERVVLVLAEGKDVPPTGELRLARVSQVEDLDNLDFELAAGEVFTRWNRPHKWQVGSTDAGTQVVDQLVESEKLVPLMRLGKTGIGYVSGANNFFVLRPSDVRRRGLPPEVLQPTVVAARQVPGAVLGAEDMRALIGMDDRCLLWAGDGSDREAVAQYIEEGEKRGLHQRYKCRVRQPWYVVPGVRVPDVFLTYMSHEIPRLTWNKFGATCSNNLLAIQLHAMNPEHIPNLVASFYNSATMLSAERIGRHYGGGVLKLEPSEGDRILVPNPAAITLPSFPMLEEVDRLLRSRRVADLLQMLDDQLLRSLFQLDPAEVQLVQEARARRRRARSGRPSDTPSVDSACREVSAIV